MASTVREISDALVTWINAGSYSSTFTAVTRRTPRYTKEEVQDLGVYVIILNRKTVQQTRTLYLREFAPIVSIDHSVNPDNATAVEALDLLVEEIENRLFAARTLTVPTLGWTLNRTTNDVEVNQEWLWDQQVYACRIISTWQAITT